MEIEVCGLVWGAIMKENWRVWDDDKKYGRLFYNRAVGQLSEMESSKTAARHVAKLVKENSIILDIGCGAGHYLVSLDKILKIPFSYHGIDATEYYIELAKEAFAQDINKNPLRISYKFEVGDIFNLDLADQYADLVMCNNVLLHLPSIEKPINELWRVTKKFLILRTLVGKTSFRIKQINLPEEYTEEGEPLNYHFFNIYSEEYILKLINRLDGVRSYRFLEDKDYNLSNIGDSNYKKGQEPRDLTVIVNGMQVNNYIIQPWHFLILEKRS